MIENIYKICFLNEIITKIYVFYGIVYDDNNNEVDLNEIYNIDKNNNYFNNIFTDQELIDINKNNTNIIFINSKLYPDDNIETIKKKILLFDDSITFEEMYLFYQNKIKLNNTKVYDKLTFNNEIYLTKDRFKQFLLNINYNISDFEDKENYDLNDIIKLNLNNKLYFVDNPLGQYISSNNNYLYNVNPFKLNIYEEYIKNYVSDILTTNNKVLLLNYNIYNNNIYLCNATDVLNNMINKGLSEEITIKLYFPHLIKYDILNLSDLNDKKLLLKRNTEDLILNESWNETIKSIDLFNNIYQEEDNKLNIINNCINKF